MDRKTLLIIFAACLAVTITLGIVFNSKINEDDTESTPVEGNSKLSVTLLASSNEKQDLKDKTSESVGDFAEAIQKEPVLFVLLCIFGLVTLASGALLIAPKVVKRNY